MNRVDYDTVAAAYDRRYQLFDYPGIRAALLRVASEPGCRRVLEVGCGTGAWLAELQASGVEVAGADPSVEMLQLAGARVEADLKRADGEALPWEAGYFDSVVFINSLHHMRSPAVAVAEAFRVLRPGGTFLSIGLDPHEGELDWYVYEFFPEALALDAARFAPFAQRRRWLTEGGFVDISVRIAERLRSDVPLKKGLQDGILEVSFTSQLTALSEAAYCAGMRRIHQAAAHDPTLCLRTDLNLYATLARRPV